MACQPMLAEIVRDDESEKKPRKAGSPGAEARRLMRNRRDLTRLQKEVYISVVALSSNPEGLSYFTPGGLANSLCSSRRRIQITLQLLVAKGFILMTPESPGIHRGCKRYRPSPVLPNDDTHNHEGGRRSAPANGRRSALYEKPIRSEEYTQEEHFQAIPKRSTPETEHSHGHGVLTQEERKRQFFQGRKPVGSDREKDRDCRKDGCRRIMEALRVPPDRCRAELRCVLAMLRRMAGWSDPDELLRLSVRDAGEIRSDPGVEKPTAVWVYRQRRRLTELGLWDESMEQWARRFKR